MTPQQKSTLLLKVVALAQSQIGVQEVPRGSNSGKMVLRYLAAAGLGGGNPWCMAFAVWCYLTVLSSLGLHLEDTTLEKTGYVQGQVNAAKARGVAISAGAAAAGTARVLPGYLMCEWEADLKRYAHTGIVEVAPNADGVFHTIEGNTNTDGGREGYLVARQTRNLHDNCSDGHPKYCFIMTC